MPTRKKRGSLPRPPVPLHQGELDGLCGIYAIINAIRRLCPEISRDTCDHLFTLQLDALSGDPTSPINAVANGIGQTALRGLIELSCEEIFRRLRISLHCRSMRLKRNASLHAIWHEMEQQTATGGVIILGLSGRYDHWTVAYRTTPRRLYLVDSSMMQFLNRKSCSTSRSLGAYQLRSDEMFGIARL